MWPQALAPRSFNPDLRSPFRRIQLPVNSATEALVAPSPSPATYTSSEDSPDPQGDAMTRPTLLVRSLNLFAILLPFAGFIAAIAFLWGTGFSWLHLGLLVGGYLLTAVGVTVGFHRLFTHKSFDTNPVITAILGILGSMAVEGPILRWVATHRKHHQHSDREDDPHSPNTHGHGVIAFIKGVVHAHCGWLFSRSHRDLMRYIPDLNSDKLVRRISKLFLLWVALGLLIPAAIGLAVSGTWLGALLGFLWGGLARVFLVHHATWSVNSICHLWGTRPFASHDHSRNNPIVGVLGLGEGWHNNHHAFPASARHGLRWWEFDASYLIIRAMALCGLATNVRVPNAERIAAKRRTRSH
jgi:stearoyl-CoA desaturase (Delta-9 desaturase)